MSTAKRIRRPGLVALGVFLLLCLAGNLTGFAATLPPDATQLGTGDVAVRSCQSAPLRASIEAMYDAQLGGYVASVVIVSGVDIDGPTGCAGQRFQIALADRQGNALSQTSGIVPMSGTSFSEDLSGADVPASRVVSISVLITN